MRLQNSRKVRGKFVTFGIICALSRVVNKIHTPPSQPNLKESNSPAGAVNDGVVRVHIVRASVEEYTTRTDD